MLAEPKRRVKYSVDPRNTNWTNDDNKFGQKLMEKMGWEKGRGLGANEDGNVQSIAVSLKNDTKGVGWNKNTEDNWIANQDDFNDLLSSLNKDHGTNVKDTNENGGHKILNLEEASRAAKGRVHYQKFTQGKDLSLRSENDLDCVFGKRKSKKYKLKSEEVFEEKTPEQELKDTEAKGGLITVTSTDSVQDYFSKKMAALKNKRNGILDTADGKTDNKDLENSSGKEEIDNMECNDSSEVITNIKKKKKKKKDKKEHISPDEDSNDTHTQDKNKMKVSFSLGDEDEQLNEAMDVEEGFDNTNMTDESNNVSQKKKKNLKVRFSMDNLEELGNSMEAEENLVSSINITADTVDSSLKKKKKKSKKKNREKEDEEGSSVNDASTVEDVTDDLAIVTDECKVKEDDAINTSDTCEPEAECDSSKKSSKKKKKRKHEDSDEPVVVKKMKLEDEEKQDGINDTEVEHLSGKKKKSKKHKKKDKLASDEISEVEAIVKSDQADTTVPKQAETKMEILNPFPNLKPEKILLEYASKTKEDVRFISSMVGPKHKPVFHMHVEIGVKIFRKVKGRSKKDAMTKAAIVAVIALNEEEKLKLIGLNGSTPVSDKSVKPKISKAIKIKGSASVKRNTSKVIKPQGSYKLHKKFEGSLGTVNGYPGFHTIAEKLSKNSKRKKRF